ncbi:hypothetical protein CSW98_12025 [Vibrio sp. HA2012]|nr:translocation/assembly module TamB domain-containing protein [Vibrio sp. HA2012]PJC85780.1 hypothetical protein CSW98_12025 [Vibrio sp. HA2012]
MRAGKILLLLMFTVLSLMVVLLLSRAGVSLMLRGAEKILPGLQVGAYQGSLWSGVTLQHIRYTDRSLYTERLHHLDVTLDRVDAEVDFSCFLQPRLCIRQLSVNGVKLALTSSDGGEHNQKKEHTASISSLPEMNIPLPVELSAFELSHLTLLPAQQQSPVQIKRVSMSAYADGHDVIIRNLTLDMPLLETELSGRASLESDYLLTLKSTTKIKQTVLSGQIVSLSVQGSKDRLQFVSNLAGPVTAQAEGVVQPMQANLPFVFNLSYGHLSWPLQSEADYQARVSALNIDGSLDGYSLKATAELSGRTIPDARIQLSGEGDSRKLSLTDMLVDTLGGDISGQALVSWYDVLSWQGKLALQNIQPGLQWKEAEGKLSGTLESSGELLASGGWQAALTEMNIQGIIREYPLIADGNLSIEDQSGKGDIHLTANGLNIRHGRNLLSLNGCINEKLDLRGKVEIPDLQSSFPDARGRISGSFSVSGSRSKPEFLASFKATKLEYGTARAGSVSVDSAITTVPDLQGKVKLQVAHALYHNQQIDSLHLLLAGQQNEHHLTLDISSELADIRGTISGAILETGEGFFPENVIWQGEVDSAQVSTKQGVWILEQSPHLTYSGETRQASVQAHCWKQAGARLCLTQDLLAGASGRAHLALQSFSFSQIQALLAEDISVDGSLDLRGSVSWAQGKMPELRMALMLSSGGIRMKDKSSLYQGWDSIQLNAILDDGELQSDWQVQLTDSGRIHGELAVSDLLKEHKPLSGRLSMEHLDLTLLDAWLGDYSHLGAHLNSDLRISGEVTHPMLYGEVLLDDILAHGEFTPVEITGGQVRLNFSGYQAGLEAELDSADGKLLLNGEGQWQDRHAWTSGITVHSDELHISLPPTAEIKVRPELRIEASPETTRISGDIYLPWARLEVESLPVSAVSVSSDEVVLDKYLNSVSKNNSLSLMLESDVKVHIGDDFHLAAFGLQGYLNGLLSISQKDRVPFVFGDVVISDGTYRSFGQDLVINKGKILMNGPLDRPYVNIEAVRNPDNIQDDVTAGITVSGLASAPEITVFSDPDMPQANALSYLLRGRDLDAKAGDNDMTMTLIGLSLAQSGKIVGEIGQAFGVSDLQLDTAGSGSDSQVTVSGYILPGLQVKYGVGIFNSLGEVTLRYQLMKDLYLETVSGLTSTVDLLYQFEFD